MSKHISVIADEAVAENSELKHKVAKLERENADLREALQHCQSSTYGDELDYADSICADDDSVTKKVLPELRGGAQ